MNSELTIKQYLDELSSSSPTPGGGNVAAFAGVISCSLGIMVCNLTMGKKKYLDVQEEIAGIKQKLETLRNEMQELAVKDNEAFEKVMEAFKLPKETDEEKQKRQKNIDEANYNAALIPSQVIDKCNEILPHIKRLTIAGNQNSVSDAGVALSLLSTSAEGALLNVLINCSSLQSNIQASELLKRADLMTENIKNECNTVLDFIKGKLNT